MKKWRALSLGMLFFVVACAQNPIPQGYTGPIATVADSITPRGATSIDVFFMEKVDDRLINDSLHATTVASTNMGFAMNRQVISRDIPAQHCTVVITGRTHYAAPILELVNKVYQISGQIEFDPQPGKKYLVTGILGDDDSAVWIEDVATSEVIGKKLEIHGSSTLEFFQK